MIMWVFDSTKQIINNMYLQKKTTKISLLIKLYSIYDSF